MFLILTGDYRSPEDIDIVEKYPTTPFYACIASVISLGLDWAQACSAARVHQANHA
jgi:hypothetical protein